VAKHQEVVRVVIANVANTKQPHIMKQIRTLILFFCLLTLIAIGVARGQTSAIGPGDGYLMLYRLEGAQGRYVLCMSFESPEKGKTSVVVVGDTFSVQPRGSVCGVIMSNAYVLQSTFGRAQSNQVVQTKFRTDPWIWAFPQQTKLIFNDSVVELPKWSIEPPGRANVKTYEGNDALRQLDKMGLGPPDDLDTNKAVGH
jgi:hypothetical protein